MLHYRSSSLNVSEFEESYQIYSLAWVSLRPQAEIIRTQDQVNQILKKQLRKQLLITCKKAPETSADGTKDWI